MCEQSSLPHIRSCRDTQNLQECLQIYVPACQVLVVKGFGGFQLLPMVLLQGGKVIAFSSVSKVYSEAHGKKVSCRLEEDISSYSLNVTIRWLIAWVPRKHMEVVTAILTWILSVQNKQVVTSH